MNSSHQFTCKLINIQTALYFEKPLKTSEAILLGIKAQEGKLKEFFDEKLSIQSIPEAPELADVPVVNLKSTKDKSALTISRSRADIYIDPLDRNIPEARSVIMEKSRIFYELCNKEEIKFNRLGIVLRMFVENDNPEKSILNFFSQDPTKIIGGSSVYSSAIKTITNAEFGGIKAHNIFEIDVGSNTLTKKRGNTLVRDFNIPIAATNSILNWIDAERFFFGCLQNLALDELTSLLSKNNEGR